METPKKYIDVLSMPVMVLNKAHTPINIFTVRRALEIWVTGRCNIIETYEDLVIHTGHNSITGKQMIIKAPCIIHMFDSNVNKSAMVKTIPLNRHNLFIRDNERCVYCDKELNENNFTIEHIVASSRGGLNDWMNLRVACHNCNFTKGDKTLEELGWRYPREVSVPTLTKKVSKNIITKIHGKISHPAWKNYVYWEVKLD